MVYLPDDTALLAALAAGEMDAVARGEVGNLVATRGANGAFMVTALDSRVETGGFAVAAADAGQAACLDRHIAWLTDSGRIGYRDWHDDREIFLWRARRWPGAE